MSEVDRERSPSINTGATAPAHATSPPPPPPSATVPGTSPPTSNPEHQAGSDIRRGTAAEAEAPQPPPPFEPLFTLLTNTTTNSTVHPRVHYIFSDDDPGVLASAAADPSQRALVVDLVPTTQQQQQPKATSENIASDPATASGHGTNGWSVAWASSLSPDFAVTASNLAVQQHGGEGNGALMLRVEGVEREPVEVGSSDATAAGAGSSGSLRNSGSGTVGGAGAREDVDGLLDDFRRRMDLLRRVVGEGDRRRDALSRQAHEQHDQHQQPPQYAQGQQLPHEEQEQAKPAGGDDATERG